MPRKRIGAIACLLALSLVGCVIAPTFLTAPNTCSVFINFRSGGFSSDPVSENWLKIDFVVSANLVDSMRRRGYRIEPVFSLAREPNEQLDATYKEMARSQCNRIVQLGRSLIGDDNGRGAASSFEYEVGVLTMTSPNSSRPGYLQVTSLYQKRYRYPITRSTMENLSLTDLGDSMARDIERSRILIKTGPVLPPAAPANGSGVRPKPVSPPPVKGRAAGR